MTTSLNSRLLVIFALFAFSCANEKKSNHIDALEDKGIVFRVVPQLIDSSNIELDFYFVSSRPETILMNWTSLSVYDPRFEKDGLLKRSKTLSEVVDSLSHPQFVVENEAGERRFFSDIELFEGEILQMKSVFSFSDEVDTIRMVPKEEVMVRSGPIGINRLRVKQTDNKVRLYYLFKPTMAENKAGYDDLCLRSNWFELK